MDNSIIIQRLNRSSARLSKSHGKIADFICNHYDKSAYMTASKLASLVGISESTVVRFANAMGYEGYPEMQKALQEIIRHCLTSNQRIEMNSFESNEAVISSVLGTDKKNITNTLKNIDIKVFNDIVSSLSNVDKIYVLGLRSAAPLAWFLSHYLSYIFDDVITVNTLNSNILETISRIKSNDALIGISFPRYSTRTLESMRFVKSRGATVIGITDGPLSPLHEASRLCLDAETDMSSFVDSMAAPMALVNALLVALGNKNQERLSKHFKYLEEIWEQHRVYTEQE